MARSYKRDSGGRFSGGGKASAPIKGGRKKKGKGKAIATGQKPKP